MKAKIRGHNLPTQRQSDLEKAARQFIDDYIDDYIKKLQYKLSRRVTFALCLILSDQHGFGQKRCQRAVEGIGEILNGVAEDVYDRNEIDPEGRDKMLDNMDAELMDRGIYITIQGDPVYGEKRKRPASAGTDTSQEK
ncbi:MAG: hypothetical protein IJW95_00100 [Clostridia bacterium]|jgi:hypothetical protein|nr:hypothetical protein [Clostridia bacterium]